MNGGRLLQQVLAHPTLAVSLTGRQDAKGDEIAWCIFHDDGNGKPPHAPDLRIGPKGYYCCACKQSGGLQKLARHLGIGPSAEASQLVKTWNYFSPDGGQVLFSKDRYQRPDGKKTYGLHRAAPADWSDCPRRAECQKQKADCRDGAIWTLKAKPCSPACPTALYNQPLLKALSEVPVYVAEGEKCCDALGELDLLAICNPYGAGEWRPQYSEALQGRGVVILADSDAPGRDHVRQVAHSLSGKAASIRVLDLYPDRTDGSDVADWTAERRAAGQSDEAIRAELESLIAGVPEHPQTSSSSPPLSGSDNDDDGRRGPVELCTLAWPGPRQWVVEGWVPAHASTVLYGDGGMGKSLQALLIGESVARGQRLFGREVQQGPVLYLDWELDREEQTRRAHRVAAGLGYSRPAPGLYYQQMTHPLGQALPQVAAWVNELRAVLVVIDSFGLATLGDPTTARDVVPLLAGVSRLPCSCLFIDHVRNLQPGETGDDLKPFGSVYKFNIARSVIRVTRVGGDEVSLALSVRQIKSNFGALSEPLGLRVTFEEARVCFEQTSAASPRHPSTARSNSGLEQVSEALSRLEPASPLQLAEAVGLSVGTVKNKLTELRRLGLAAPAARGIWARGAPSSSPSLPVSSGDEDDAAGPEARVHSQPTEETNETN